LHLDPGKWPVTAIEQHVTPCSRLVALHVWAILQR
jgi:hypothetical protein